ncbi:MAG TPA: DUF4328 domain-containing protein [Acidimicrobiales bacterium]
MSDQQGGYPGAPPGWYADPAGGPGQRWRDGYAWTDAVVQPAEPPPPPAPMASYPPPTGPAVRSQSDAGFPGHRELAVAPLARIAVAVPGLYFLASLVNVRLHAAQYRVIGHEYHVMLQATQNNQTVPNFTIPNGFYGGFSVVVWLVGLATLVAVIIGATWQHRAASTARALRWPATHSPGWGVGSWWVPVVNYWMPYQALRDCLEPSDPGRQLVLRYWLFMVASWTLNAAVQFAAFFSSGAALGLAIPAAVCALGILATAPSVVTAITSAHRAAIDGSTGRVS